MSTLSITYPEEQRLPSEIEQELAAIYQHNIACECTGHGNNLVWRITHGSANNPDHDYLKIYTHNKRGFQTEKTSLELLSGHIPVPHIRHASSNDDPTRSPYLITRGITGQPVDLITSHPMRKRCIKDLGKQIAILHSSGPEITKHFAICGLQIDTDSLLSRSRAASISHLISQEMVASAAYAIQNPARPVLSQMDCGDWQCIAKNGILTGIVYWECTQLANPEHDLANATVFLDCFRGPEESRLLTNSYQKHSSHDIDLQLLEAIRHYILIDLCLMWFTNGKTFEYEAVLRALKKTTAPEDANQGGQS